MSNVAEAPLRNDPSSDLGGLRLPQFGRRQVIGVVFGLIGIALLAFVAPNITSDPRAFAFERPPIRSSSSSTRSCSWSSSACSTW